MTRQYCKLGLPEEGFTANSLVQGFLLKKKDANFPFHVQTASDMIHRTSCGLWDTYGNTFLKLARIEYCNCKENQISKKQCSLLYLK